MAEGLSRAGAHDQAFAGFARSLDILSRLGQHAYLPIVYAHLGHAHSRAAMPEKARASWRRALVLLDEHNVDDNAEVDRSELRALIAEVDANVAERSDG